MSRSIRSGATGRRSWCADDVVLRGDAGRSAAISARPAPSISFFPSGMSCGGVIALTRHGVGYEVRVNWLTGGVEIVARNSP